MRVIKFRAWDGKEFLPLAREVAFIDDDGVLRSRIEGIIFNEYTGFQDKHGKEICEGDIVKAEWHWIDPHTITWPDDYYDLREYALDKEDLEVIGNIYEHPEFIAEKEQ
jgi:hypothetical protein